MSSQKLGAIAATSIAPEKSVTPPMNILRRPVRSARDPVIAMKLAKVKKNALTTHCAALRPVCRLSLTLGRANDAPVAEMGTSTMAAQTISNVTPGRARKGTGRNAVEIDMRSPVEVEEHCA
jgi:hypothetical protein